MVLLPLKTVAISKIGVFSIAMVMPLAASILAWSDLLTRLGAVVALIAINAFFVMAEFSIVAVRRSRINQLVQEGDLQAKTVQHLQREIDRLLSTTQLGITLSSLALGWIAEKTVALILITGLHVWPPTARNSTLWAHSVAIPVAFVAIAYLQIVLGELCPKSLALLYSEQLARFLGPISIVIARLFKPFIWVLKQSTRCLLRLFGVNASIQQWTNELTPEELQLIIANSTAASGLKADERELLTNVFEFRDAQVEEVMVPRTQVDAIPLTATIQMVLEEVARSGHDYYPVMGESLDDIQGLLRFKDLAAALASGQHHSETLVRAWVQPAHFILEGTPIREVLQRMQAAHLAMMVVREDQSYGTAGVVTLTDLVHEIIGNDEEPTLVPIPPIQEQDNHTFLIQAQTDLDVVNEQLAIALPTTDDYHTLGGFLLNLFQKLPTQGETLVHNNLRFTVVTTAGPRLDQIRVQILNTPQSPVSPSPGLTPPPQAPL